MRLQERWQTDTDPEGRSQTVRQCPRDTQTGPSVSLMNVLRKCEGKGKEELLAGQEGRAGGGSEWRLMLWPLSSASKDEQLSLIHI